MILQSHCPPKKNLTQRPQVSTKLNFYWVLIPLDIGSANNYEINSIKPLSKYNTPKGIHTLDNFIDTDSSRSGNLEKLEANMMMKTMKHGEATQIADIANFKEGVAPKPPPKDLYNIGKKAKAANSSPLLGHDITEDLYNVENTNTPPEMYNPQADIDAAYDDLENPAVDDAFPLQDADNIEEDLFMKNFLQSALDVSDADLEAQFQSLDTSDINQTTDIQQNLMDDLLNTNRTSTTAPEIEMQTFPEESTPTSRFLLENDTEAPVPKSENIFGEVGSPFDKKDLTFTDYIKEFSPRDSVGDKLSTRLHGNSRHVKIWKELGGKFTDEEQAHIDSIDTDVQDNFNLTQQERDEIMNATPDERAEILDNYHQDSLDSMQTLDEYTSVQNGRGGKTILSNEIGGAVNPLNIGVGFIAGGLASGGVGALLKKYDPDMKEVYKQSIVGGAGNLIGESAVLGLGGTAIGAAGAGAAAAAPSTAIAIAFTATAAAAPTCAATRSTPIIALPSDISAAAA